MNSIPLAPASVVYVYGLVDPRTPAVRYIGVSTAPHRRLIEHLSLRNKAATHKNNWLNALVRAGLRPALVILDTVSAHEAWAAFEQFYITAYRSAGFDLVNTALGGRGGLSGAAHHWYGRRGAQHNQGGENNWQRKNPERVRRAEH